MSAHFTLSGKIKQVGILALSGGVKKSAISYQLSAISYQLSAISYQLSAIRCQDEFVLG
ncbi:hypothetical protein [Pseudoalteromonas haloplanktis]|uniref:hypothetical protein n=1 Tax=Pseudoalteromonas haloplanktis TaxID=228 RepID=UPI00031A3EAF|nr:hypothetical protein [Pseudoalteromonas haloplanktis]